MRTRYSFEDWKSGAAIPSDFKLCRAFNAAADRNAFMLALLPGEATRAEPLYWEDKDMAKTGWRVLPYGFGVDRDRKGGVILFDRGYRAICSIGKAGLVRWIDAADKTWMAGNKVFLYDDGTGPRRHRETRRLCLAIVQRFGLGRELRRRAVLQRYGLLPESHETREPRTTEAYQAIERATSDKLTFAFDTVSGQTLRVRPPISAGEEWKPRPVNDDDISGIVRWLKSKGHIGAGKRNVIAAVNAIGARRGVVWLPD